MSKQAETLRRTLEEKKRLKELAKTNQELATKRLMEMVYERTHRPQGISSTNAQKARKYKKESCERCGALHRLVVHHKNKNQTDNRPENIQTLCSSCHHTVHGLRKQKEWE